MKIFKRVREESQEEEQNTYPVNKMARIEEIEVAGSNTEITKKYKKRLGNEQNIVGNPRKYKEITKTAERLV